MRLCECPQPDLHADLEGPVPGEAVSRQLHAAPAPLGILPGGGKGRDEVAPLQVFDHRGHGRCHAGLQPLQDGHPVDVRHPEVVGIARQVVPDKAQNVVAHDVLVAEVLQNAVRQGPEKCLFCGICLLTVLEEGIPGHTMAQGRAGDDGHIQKTRIAKSQPSSA